MRKRLDHMLKAIAIGIHGDGTPAMGAGKSWAKSIDLWNWRSLLVATHSQLSMFLIFAIHASLRTQKTLDVAFRKLVWSFNALQEGKWPTKDWNGVRMVYEKALSLCLEDLIS